MTAAMSERSKVEPSGIGQARPRRCTVKSPGKRPNPKRDRNLESPEKSTRASTVVINHLSMIHACYPRARQSPRVIDMAFMLALGMS
jgi:hypothetical protein